MARKFAECHWERKSCSALISSWDVSFVSESVWEKMLIMNRSVLGIAENSVSL